MIKMEPWLDMEVAKQKMFVSLRISDYWHEISPDAGLGCLDLHLHIATVTSQKLDPGGILLLQTK